MSHIENEILHGSPISPILAPFYTAKLLEKFKPKPTIRPSNNTDKATEVHLFMYVDDGKLYVFSKSLKTNVEREWSWNGQFHMDSGHIHHGFPWTSPHGFHGTSPYGFHGTSPYGFRGTNLDGINDYHICSVLTILSKKKFCTVMKSNPQPHQ